MITEDHVSLELAKLLKEKGFDEKCFGLYTIFYDDEGEQRIEYERWVSKARNNSLEDISFLCSAPTLQMAMKWLREVHNLYCDIGYDDLNWFWDIVSISENVPVKDRPKIIKNGYACKENYEQAAEEAIKYCLENLI